jgi:hypothetical protein
MILMHRKVNLNIESNSIQNFMVVAPPPPEPVPVEIPVEEKVEDKKKEAAAAKGKKKGKAAEVEAPPVVSFFQHSILFLF